MEKIDVRQLIQILNYTPDSQNIMLVGKHGIGKSQILERFYTEKGYKVVTLFLNHFGDVGDLIGIPHKNEVTGHTEFMPPYWFPTDDTPIVLFLDELNRARPEILQTIMDLALNRKLAGRSLPAGSRIISAVNNGDEYQLTDLDPALVSRFNIYEFIPSVQDFFKWANRNGIDSRIISFISENPEYLDGDGIDEDNSLEKHPDRRAWQRVSQILFKKELDKNLTFIIAGIIGRPVTNLFYKWVISNLDENEVSAKKILYDFNKYSTMLEQISQNKLGIIVNDLFSLLNTMSISEDDAHIFSKNIDSFMNFLVKISHESAGLFLSNISSQQYRIANQFIFKNCHETVEACEGLIKTWRIPESKKIS